jgi:hypothetical protein
VPPRPPRRTGPGRSSRQPRRLILLARRMDETKSAYDQALAAWEAELERLRRPA